MSPKFTLWVIFALISCAWYALDPAARGHSFGAPTQAVAAASPAPGTVPRIAGN